MAAFGGCDDEQALPRVQGSATDGWFRAAVGRRGAGMQSRGMTLIEVVVALAVILFLSALAAPALWGRLGDARLNAAARQLEAVVISIRAQSQGQGSAMALVAKTDGRGTRLVAQRLDGAGANLLDEEESEPVTPALREIGRLPEGVLVRMAGDASAEGRLRETEPSRLDARDSNATSSMRVAVMLPDGSVIVRGPVELALRSSTINVTINRWTGACTVRRGSSLAPGEPRDDESSFTAEGAR